METLDRVVKNRTVDFFNRMEAISLFKYILTNKNLVTGQSLKFFVNVNVRHMIR